MSTLKVSSGGFTLQAEGPVRSRKVYGIQSGDRAALYAASLGGGAEQVANDDSFDELYFVAEHCVLDAAGVRVSPVLERVAVLNYGYIWTWSQMFWREGFCVHGGRIAFVSVGADEGYSAYAGTLRYVTSGVGERVTRDTLETHLSVETVALSRAEVEAMPLMAHHVSDWQHEAL